MTHRCLPPDVSSDIHQIIAKAIFRRLLGVHNTGPLILEREELARAADAEFEYDMLDDGSLLFRPAQEQVGT